MNSTAAGLLGAQRPRVSLVPAAPRSDASDAAFLAGSYGLAPDDWQLHVLEGWLGLRADGKWASPRCGLAVPRQNGKNAVVEVRELYGMVVLGEKWLHTAHEVKTARKAFLRLLGFFDNPRQYPELHDLVEDIRKTNGQEAIVLRNGGSVEFVARSRGSGRGFTVDGLLCDEAQELSEEAVAALLPTISSAPLGNPQQIYTGTPPGPTAVGEVFTRIRQTGQLGKDRRLCWHEWGSDPKADPDDRRAWVEANPSLGIRLGLEAIMDERATMDDDTFGRERLGIWDIDLGVEWAIPPGAWDEHFEPDAKPSGRPVFAYDVSPSRDMAAIAVAVPSNLKVPLLEVTGRVEGGAETLDVHPGVEWLVPRLVQLCTEWDTWTVTCTGRAAEALKPELERQNITVNVLNGGELAQACGALYDAAVGPARRGMVHSGQGLLRKALGLAKKRETDDGWTWTRRKSTGDITPVVAVTCAFWQLTSTPTRQTFVSMR